MNQLLEDYYQAEKIRKEINNKIKNVKNYSHISTKYCQEFRNNNFLSRFPIEVSVKITNQCNLNCYYCSNRNNKFKSNEGKLLENQDFLNLFEYLGKNKIIVYLTGGEPFKNPNILSYVEILAQYNIPFKIFTNGTLLNESIIRYLHKITLDKHFSIQVSLDGDDEIMTSFTKNKNVYTSIYNNLKCLKKFGINVRLKCVLTKRNLSKMIFLSDLCNELKIDELILTPVFVFPHNFKILPNDKLIVQYYIKLIKHCKVKNYKIYINQSPLVCGANIGMTEINDNCPAGISSCDINEFGDVYPCSYLDVPKYHFGNIKNENLENIWNNQKWDVLRKRKHLIKCKIKNCKGLCPASSYYGYNTLNKCDIRCDIIRNKEFI